MTQPQQSVRGKRRLLVVACAGIGTTACLVGLALFAWYYARGPSFRQLENAAAISDRHGVQIVTVDGPVETDSGNGDTVRADPAPANEMQEFLIVLAVELGLYPPELVSQARTRRVVLCGELFSTSAGSAGGLTDYAHGDLYFDVSCWKGNRTNARRAIHHEFFHLLVYRQEGEKMHEDTAWAALNPPGFRYGQADRSLLAEGETGFQPSIQFPGFLNYYSTTKINEDKAEIFSHLLARPEYIAKRARTDKVIQAKVLRMKSILRTFCPKMDAEFWAHVCVLRAQDDSKRR